MPALAPPEAEPDALSRSRDDAADWAQPIGAITDRELRQLLAYLRTGSYSRAGRRCRVSRNTVSETVERWRPTLVRLVLEATRAEIRDENRANCTGRGESGTGGV